MEKGLNSPRDAGRAISEKGFERFEAEFPAGCRESRRTEKDHGKAAG